MVAYSLFHILIAPLLLFAACTRRARTRLKTDSVPPERLAEMKEFFGPKRLATQHRRSRMTRREKRKIGRFHPYTVLRVLYNANLPENKREALATLLPTFARSFGWTTDNRTTSLVCNKIWDQLLVEQNPLFQRPLMLLASRLFENFLSFVTWRGREDEVLPFVLGILNQDLVRYEMREASLEILAQMTDEWEWNDELDVEPFLAIWHRLLEKQRSSLPFSDRLMAFAVLCARNLIREDHFPAGTCPPMVLWYAADQATMDFLFESILSDSAPLREEPWWSRGFRCSWFMGAVLKRLPAEERATFVRHYGAQLRQAVVVMHPNHITEFAQHDEFLAIIATTPSALMNVWEGGARHRCTGSYARQSPLSRWPITTYCSENQLANVIFWSLQHALSDPPRLQSMLGEGFIVLAHHYASNEYDTSPHVANVFRRILAFHPELEPRFKEIARFGCATNETAILARSLMERPCKVGWYIFNEENESSSSEESDGSDEDSNEKSSSDSHDEDVDGESSRSQDSDDVE